jgi:Bifunctional DNA primase/polymerase, N-terminal
MSIFDKEHAQSKMLIEKRKREMPYRDSYYKLAGPFERYDNSLNQLTNSNESTFLYRDSRSEKITYFIGGHVEDLIQTSGNIEESMKAIQKLKSLVLLDTILIHDSELVMLKNLFLNLCYRKNIHCLPSNRVSLDDVSQLSELKNDDLKEDFLQCLDAEGYFLQIPANWLVIEVDSSNEAHKSFEELSMRFSLPISFSVMTESGKRQIYFNVPEDLSFHQTLNDFPGLTFLGKGNWIIGPGSTIDNEEYLDIVNCENTSLNRFNFEPLPTNLITELTVKVKSQVEDYNRLSFLSEFANAETKSYVYTLEDAFTKETVYVGRTSSTVLFTCLDKHISKAIHRKTDKDRWISGLIAKGQKPILKIIEECNVENIEERKEYWIAKYRETGSNLLNVENPQMILKFTQEIELIENSETVNEEIENLQPKDNGLIIVFSIDSSKNSPNDWRKRLKA